MNNIRKQSIFVFILYSLLLIPLSSCGIYGKYHPVQDIDSTLYGDLSLSDTAQSLSNLSWDALFTDPLLQDLIRQALDSNLDLRIAHEHVLQAEASLRGAQLAYLPSISIAPQGGFSPQYSIRQGTYDLVASASWEIDIFGRTLNSLRGAKAARQQALDYEQASRCGLIAGVANAYYTLLMLDAQLQTAEKNEQTWAKTIHTIRRMKEAGMADEAAVTQMEATYYSIQTMVLDSRQQIRQTENALCLMLGTTYRPINRSTLDAQGLAAEHRGGSTCATALQPPRRARCAAEYGTRFLCRQSLAQQLSALAQPERYVRLDEPRLCTGVQPRTDGQQLSSKLSRPALQLGAQHCTGENGKVAATGSPTHFYADGTLGGQRGERCSPRLSNGIRQVRTLRQAGRCTQPCTTRHHAQDAIRQHHLSRSSDCPEQPSHC